MSENISIFGQFDKNTTVSDYIKQHKGSKADCYDLIVNDKVIPKHKRMQETVKMKFQERQVDFHICVDYEPSIPVKFGLAKTIKSLKDYLHDEKEFFIDQYRLTFNGKTLDDEATLFDSKIVNGSILNLEELQNKNILVSDLIKMWKDKKADYYDLVADGEVIPRHETLSQAHIYKKSKLELQERMVSFKVKIIDNNNDYCNENYPPLRVNFLPNKTISDLIEHLRATEYIKDFVLVFENCILKDHQTIEECEVKNESEIKMIVRLRGG